MSWGESLRLALQPLLDRRRAERELDDELAFHLEMEVARLVEGGMAPEAARRDALIRFGGVEKTKEECRDQRRLHALETLLQDLAYGLRSLRGQPAYTLAAVLTLALGIGANAAIFTTVRSVLLEPLPYAHGERLLLIRHQAPRLGIENLRLSVPEIVDYRSWNQTLDGLVEYHSMSFNLLGRGEPLRVRTGVVSASFFDLLGVEPLHGRTFVAADESAEAEAVLVLSHDFWQRQLGGDRRVVGETFEMNDRVHTVIGVLPPIPQYPDANDVYMPTSACPFRAAPATVHGRTRRGYVAIARLAPGASQAAAEADLATIARRLADEYPESYPKDGAFEVEALPVFEQLTADARPTLLLLFATVGAVLLIAAANVANLSLARLLGRRQELALRSALGAGPWRLTRQLMVESLLLALAAGAAGLVLAAAGVDLLAAYAARFTPRAGEVSLDAGVVLFTLGLSLAVGLGLGAVGALQALRGHTGADLKQGGSRAGGPGRQPLRRALVVAQVAVSVLLLAAAGLMVRSLIALQRVDPGFDPEGVLKARIDLDWTRYTDDETRRGFYRELLPRVAELPGVTAAALSGDVPFDRQPGTTGFAIEGRSLEPGQPAPRAELQVASPGYFQVLGIPLLDGRTFEAGDREDGTLVAVVNRSLARRHWGGGSPIGRRLTFDNETFYSIVGVVGDVKHHGLASEVRDEIYLAFPQQTALSVRLVARVAVPPTELARPLRQAVYAVDPRQPVSEIETLGELRREDLASPRLTATLLSLFAVLALAITAGGLAGLLAFSVAQRRHEIGVRLALGAARTSVLGLILRQGLSLVAAGLAFGVGLSLAGAWASSQTLGTMLFQVEPTDPMTFVAVAALLAAVAFLACLLPGRRATAIDPMLALRAE